MARKPKNAAKAVSDDQREDEDVEKAQSQRVRPLEGGEGPRPVLFGHDDGRGVGGDAEIGGVSERSQSGESQEQVQAHREDAEHEYLRHQALHEQV